MNGGSPYVALKTAPAREMPMAEFYFAYCIDCGEYIGVVYEPDLQLRCSDCAPRPSWAKEVST